MRSETDLTAQARIRDVALERFATDGFARTSVRAIAADAGVSPALILHHFGSKEGLRDACDAYVFDFFKSMFRESAEPAFTAESMVLVRYLMREASEDSPRANALVADIVELTKESMAQQTREGTVRPTDDPDMRAAVLVMLRLGPLLFRGAMEKATGADVLAADGLQRMYDTILEILDSGIYTGEHRDH